MLKTPPRNPFAVDLERYRKRLGWDEAQAAALIGIGERRYRAWESGRSQPDANGKANATVRMLAECERAGVSEPPYQ